MAAKKAAISVSIIGDAAQARAAFQDAQRAAGNMGDKLKSMGTIVAGATAAAGAAIASFVVKSIGDFQDLALSVDKFRDASGLTLDQASRWTEVAGDIGVDAGSIQTAINKMNKEAEKGEGYFNKLGIEMGKHADGTYDPQQTFLNVIDALKGMKDPADKAKVATQLLGKGWMDLADLINRGSGDLQQSLQGVSDAKIIDEAEVQKAQEFREKMDNLKDAFEEVALKVGEALIPVLSKVLDVLGPVLKGLDLLFPEDLLGDAITKAQEAKDAWDKWNGTLGDNRTALNDARYAMMQARDTIGDFDTDLNGLIDTWDEFLGQLSNEEAWISLEDKIAAANDATWKAFAENTPEAWRSADKARIDAQQGVADYIKKLGDVPPEIQSQILALVDQQKYDVAMRMLEELSQPRHVQLIVEEHQRIGRMSPYSSTSSTVATFSSTPGRAFGGPVLANSPYLVGENGPELFVPRAGGQIVPNTGAPQIIINIAGSVTSERDLIEVVRKGLVQAQRSGYQLVL